MKKFINVIAVVTAIFMIVPALAATGKNIKTEEVTYQSADGTTCKGFVAYDDELKGTRPVVLVVHEWWGCNDYSRMRARMLAELGYLAFAVDMFGDGKTADDPKRAMELTGPFYKDPSLALTRLQAAEKQAKTYAQADPSRIGAIGYCFGGSMVMNGAKMKMDFDAVVSFHGGLQGVPAQKGVETKMLVCHGGADSFVPEEDIKNFKNNLDSAGVSYEFIVYPGATHAFTNPGATEKGKKFNLPIAYNEAGDKKSWEDMKGFLEKNLK